MPSVSRHLGRFGHKLALLVREEDDYKGELPPRIAWMGRGNIQSVPAERRTVYDQSTGGETLEGNTVLISLPVNLITRRVLRNNGEYWFYCLDEGSLYYHTRFEPVQRPTENSKLGRAYITLCKFEPCPDCYDVHWCDVPKKCACPNGVSVNYTSAEEDTLIEFLNKQTEGTCVFIEGGSYPGGEITVSYLKLYPLSETAVTVGTVTYASGVEGVESFL